MKEKIKVKILLVDDKKENLTALRTILQNPLYEFVEALSGKAALLILRKEQDFAVILMDVQMFLMDGFETTELIREREKLKLVPIIFHGVNLNSRENIFKGDQVSAVDYMIKPISPSILRAKVAVFVDLYRKQWELKMKEGQLKNKYKKILKSNKELSFRREELEMRVKALSDSNKELEAFAYVSSHDLQEPLRQMQMFASHLMEREQKNLSETGKDHLQRIYKLGQRMQLLIQDLLSFSRMSGKDLLFEKTHLRNIIDEVKEDFREELLKKNAVIVTDEIGEVWIIPFQFRQLMHNLLSNALKFSKPDIPPEIVIRSCVIPYEELRKSTLSKRPKYCHIAVSDNGIGFDPQHKEKIFEVFQRLHIRENYSGSGIGLAIVKKIVENHSGTITATGELHKGARFDIYIPEN